VHVVPRPGWYRPATPRTLGTLAVVFGVVVASFSALTLLTGGRMQQDDERYPAAAVEAFTAATRHATVGTSLILVAMSLTLATLGGALRRYERWAVRASQRWAVGALFIVAALTYVNAAVVGPAAAALFDSAKDEELAQMVKVMRWAGLGTALIYAPFPLVLLSQLRRPEVVAAMDQPRRG
jgi:hypothetical protein